jgi:hypothetical protein
MSTALQTTPRFRSNQSPLPKSGDNRRLFTSSRPIEIVCDRIIRDFRRGAQRRTICGVYELRAEAFDEILREALRAARPVLALGCIMALLYQRGVSLSHAAVIAAASWLGVVLIVSIALDSFVRPRWRWLVPLLSVPVWAWIVWRLAR